MEEEEEAKEKNEEEENEEEEEEMEDRWKRKSGKTGGKQRGSERHQIVIRIKDKVCNIQDNKTDKRGKRGEGRIRDKDEKKD